MNAAPDYVAPVEGWRAWSLVRDARGTRLRSVYADTPWDVGRAFTASCRRTCRSIVRPWRTFTPDHAAPRMTCTCGVYASVELDPIVRLLSAPLAGEPHEIGRAIGTVALWGEVVECTRGWRASHAYPRRLYLWGPALTAGARAEGVDVLVDELSGYRVPVERIEAAARSEVVRVLDRG